jgi:hypothetical protein
VETIDREIIGDIIERPGFEIDTQIKEDITDLIIPDWVGPKFPMLEEETTQEESDESEETQEADSGNK